MSKHPSDNNPKAFRQAYDQATNMPVPFRDLVYSLREWEVKASSNMVPYSNYDAAGWTCTATDRGLISVGPFADDNLVRWSLDNVATENGIQTWSGNGVARMTTGIDMSGWSSVVFGVEFGAYQRSATREFTVVLGACDEDGSNMTALRSWTVRSGKKIWLASALAQIVPPVTQAAVCFYLDVTTDADGWWYFCAAQAERDASSLGPYRRTSGSSIIYAVDTLKRGVAKIDYRQYEELRNPQDNVAEPREGQDPAVHGSPSEVEL